LFFCHKISFLSSNIYHKKASVAAIGWERSEKTAVLPVLPGKHNEKAFFGNRKSEGGGHTVPGKADGQIFPEKSAGCIMRTITAGKQKTGKR